MPTQRKACALSLSLLLYAATRLPAAVSVLRRNQRIVELFEDILGSDIDALRALLGDAQFDPGNAEDVLCDLLTYYLAGPGKPADLLKPKVELFASELTLNCLYVWRDGALIESTAALHSLLAGSDIDAQFPAQLFALPLKSSMCISARREVRLCTDSKRTARRIGRWECFVS